MKEKNRFSSLLKHLMTIAGVKNYALAKDLQFDESYVSKMISGSLMPPKKTSEKIIRTISRHIADALDSDSRAELMEEYRIVREKDLEHVIYDNLMAEYLYVMGLKEETGSEVAQKTKYFPELTLPQVMQKSRYPLLRQMRELNVISAMNLLALDRNYQLTVREMENNENVVYKTTPNIHYYMLINLDDNREQNLYNVSFLVNLLTNMADIDFQIFVWPQAADKLVFAVRDAYSIAGMVIDENHCISVTASEDVGNTNAIFDRLKMLCTTENILVRRTSMEDMLLSSDYVRFLLARNQRWLLGHFTEHLVPDELFGELVKGYCENRQVKPDELLRIRAMTRSVIADLGGRIILSEQAITDFAVTGELDFFGTKITLNPQQRLAVLGNMAEGRQGAKCRMKIMKAGTVPENQSVFRASMFLSDALGCLRLIRGGTEQNVSIINKIQMLDMCKNYFDEVWSSARFHYYEREEEMAEVIQYAIHMTEVQLAER